MNREQLSQLSHEQLVDMVLRQQQQQQHQQPSPDQNASVDDQDDNALKQKNAKNVKKKHRKQGNRPFNIRHHRTRFIALKFCYIGINYQGFAKQPHTKNTVEEKLFDALKRLRLVGDDFDGVHSNTGNKTGQDAVQKDASRFYGYSRCGRTDSGVSALGQVVALRVRSQSKGDHGNEDDSDEMDYVAKLNKELPDDIRILAWAPVDAQFSARFSCIYRTYKYFFPKKNLDIRRMRLAAQDFVGLHDFRNFCKINIGQVSHFNRRVLSVRIVRSDLVNQKSSSSDGDHDDYFAMYEFVVVGYSFLWHQIRCMIAALFLVGEGKEDTSIIHELLDVEKHGDGRPQYNMAPEVPLMMYDCGFEGVQWRHCGTAFHQHLLEQHYFSLWENAAVKSALISSAYRATQDAVVSRNRMLTASHYMRRQKHGKRPSAIGTTVVETAEGDPQDLVTWEEMKRATKDSIRTNYVPLLKREKADSFEQKQRSFEQKKQRLAMEEDTDE